MIAEPEPIRWQHVAKPLARKKLCHAVAATPDVPHPNGRTGKAAPGECGIPGQHSAAKTGGGRSLSDLAQIRSVAFCCRECQTVVTLPWIRWANFPEECPNCGARWMRRPSADDSFSEDDPTYVYRVVSAFREALGKLIGLRRTAVFRFLLEIGESSDHANCGRTENRRRGNAHA